MKYVIDAPLTNILYSINRIIEYNTFQENNEPYLQVEEYNNGVISLKLSSTNDYFNFEDNIGERTDGGYLLSIGGESIKGFSRAK